MAHVYRLKTSPVADMPGALAEVQAVLQHIAGYPGVTLIGVSMLGTATVTTDNPIPPEEVAHLELVEL